MRAGQTAPSRAGVKFWSIASIPRSLIYIDGSGTDALEERRRFCGVILRIFGFDTQKEAIQRSALKSRRIEDRVIQQWISPQIAINPKTALYAAPSTIPSKVIGMNAGQLKNGRPPMFIG
jgi:hypothetical protein